MYEGMRHSGLMSELHSFTTAPFSIRTMPTSVIRSWAALPPVVSKSTNTRSCGRMKAAAAQASAASIERQQRVVQIGAPIAEHAPRLPVPPHLVQVERGGENRLAAAISLGELLAHRGGNERRAVERHRVFFALFRADAVRCHQRHDVGRSVALHGALPMRAGIQIRILRLRSDGGRIQQYFRAHQRHAARRFRKPLIPTDRHTELRELRVEDFETGVAGREVIFFVISRPFGYVRLAIAAEYGAVRIDHHQRIIEDVIGMFEHADRQHHPEFARQLAKMFHGRVTVQGLGEFEMMRRVILAKIRGLEQLLNQDHVRAARRSLADQFLGARHIGVAIPTARHLRGGYRYLAHASVCYLLRTKTWVVNWRSRSRTLPARDCGIDGEWSS